MSTKQSRVFASLALTLALVTPCAAEAPQVAATIVPLHGLVAAVMEGAGAPELIVPPSESPHTFSLKPSQAATLRHAAVLFWAGEGVESFIGGALTSLGANARVVALSEVEGVTRLPVREGGAWEAHEHHAGEAHEEHEHEEDEAHSEDEHHSEYDAHSWLDPQNGIAMTREIVRVLSEVDAGNAALYAANGEKLIAAISAREQQIAQELAPLAGRGFILFHDATQYFEQRFGLKGVGSITVNPEIPPGAKRLGELKEAIRSGGAVCVFAEPHFDRRIVDTIVEDTGARVETIDVEGALLEPGPQAYLQLLDGLAASFRACLSP